MSTKPTITTEIQAWADELIRTKLRDERLEIARFVFEEAHRNPVKDVDIAKIASRIKRRALTGLW